MNGLEVMRGYNDWDHGDCSTSADCPINNIRRQIHDLVDPTVDPHEPCVDRRCHTLWYGFACTRWGAKD